MNVFCFYYKDMFMTYHAFFYRFISKNSELITSFYFLIHRTHFRPQGNRFYRSIYDMKSNIYIFMLSLLIILDIHQYVL